MTNFHIVKINRDESRVFAIHQSGYEYFIAQEVDGTDVEYNFIKDEQFYNKTEQGLRNNLDEIVERELTN